MKTLPLGTSTFTVLREGNEIYVDKTDLIFELAKNRKKIFLVRPHLFGKSLLVSTFEDLFKHSLKNFKGLAIEKLWTDKTYGVVRLDFSLVKEFETADQFCEKFHELLVQNFGWEGFQLGHSGLGPMSQISDWLRSLSPSSLVILIDEYDAPLTACLDRPELFSKVRAVMSDFFMMLKSNEGCLRFFFMTGITKFSNTSIFSAFNNMLDISMVPEFGELLGYTEEEIRKDFCSYIEKAAKILNISESEVLNQLKIYYDGFCFDEQAKTHVYCPWSILNFLNLPSRGFQNYWYASGGQPTVLKKFLMNHELEEPINFGQIKQLRLSDLNASRQYDDINIDVLLTQSGYLTIRSILNGGYAVLGYPNQEVKLSMAQLYADELLKGKSLDDPQAPLISDILRKGSTEDVIAVFNRAAQAIDYHRYPITDEASCRAYLQVLLIGSALIPHVEVHNALGRSDMEVEVGNRHWVFEFKYAKDEDKVPELLQEAVEQIQNRRYGTAKAGEELIRVALVFSAQSRRITAWKQVDGVQS